MVQAVRKTTEIPQQCGIFNAIPSQRRVLVVGGSI